LKLQLTITLLAAAEAVVLAPPANADTWNEKTILTFSAPVEIPGQTLPAGTYVFKLIDSQSNRHIVQVMSKDENRAYGVFLAIPDYRATRSDKTIVTFKERPAGSPPALKGWFYPAKNFGHEFVYPKAEAVKLAAANSTPVPSIPEAPPVAETRVMIVALNHAPIHAEKPNGEEVEVAQAFETSPPRDGLPDELPTTGSALPLIGMIGLLSIGTAGVLRRVAVKSK
jgi:hypothetical protein